MRRLLLRVAILVVVLVLGVSWFLGGVLTRPVNHAIGAVPAGVESVSFPSKSGQPIHGWFLPGKPGRGAVMILHGVRGDRTTGLKRARFLVEAGLAVLLFDFQAHGESPGEEISFGHFERLDAQAAAGWLRARLPGEKIGAIGVSLGGAAALLGDLELDAWILESVYPSIDLAIGNRLGHLLGPVGWGLSPLLTQQCWLRYGVGPGALRPIDHVGRIRSPKLLIAGSLDPHTPLAESQSLFAAASSPKELWIVEGAGHADLCDFAPVAYRQRVLAFLGRHLVSR